MKHYTEVDLLELYYSGDRGPATTHMADCPECSARFALLRKKLFEARESSCDSSQRPETFWARQRMSILRTVQSERTRPSAMPLAKRLAVAASLVVLAGTGTYVATRDAQNGSQRPPVQARQNPAPTPVPAASETELAVLTAGSDPWESDELSGYHEAVRWESWLQPAPEKTGGAL